MQENKPDQNRLDRLYDDRLDGFIEPDFFERKSREWRQTQKRLADQITEYQEAANDYVQDGIRLLELSKKAYFLYKQQDSSEKRKLLNFVCSNSIWKDHTLTATFRQPFDLLAVTNTTWQRKRPPVPIPATFVLSGSAVGLELARYAARNPKSINAVLRVMNMKGARRSVLLPDRCW